MKLGEEKLGPSNALISPRGLHQYNRYAPLPEIHPTMTKSPFENALNPITDNQGFTLSCPSTYSGLREVSSAFYSYQAPLRRHP